MSIEKSDSSYEPLLNGQLAQLLAEENLNASAEQAVSSGRMDIKVRFDTHIVAIECENYGIGKQVAAVDDAIKRIIPKDDLGSADADIAIALIYPPNCCPASLADCTDLEFTIVHPADVHDLTSYEISDQSQWTLSSVNGLAATVRRLNDDIGNPDVFAQKLNKSLEYAVEQLSIYQRKQIAQSLNLPEDETDPEFRAAAKRAMLVVASAAMFHGRLNSYLVDMKPQTDARTGESFQGDWPPLRLQQCLQSDDLIGALRDAWNLILSIDYRPIFETGIAAIDGVTHDPNLTAAFRRVVSASLSIVRVVEGLRHDLLGRIFHAVLDNARYDGSFYTTTAAATLLAGLAIRGSTDLTENLADMRVIDPSCGTGTLLMATAERIKDVVGDVNDSVLIENVLSGYDINLTATHMAATTLGLLSPTTKFHKMNIFLAAFGATENHAHSVKTGSLEIYDEGDSLPFFDWPGSMQQFETGVNRREVEKADIVIMNPPFTRNSLRHNQLGEKVKNDVKKREREIFSKAPVKVSFTSSGPAFLVLAEYLANSKKSTLAVVLPLSAAMNPSTQSIRQFLANEFQIEIVVTSHDPRRFWFSENTSISEMLVVMRRSKEKNPTRFVNLSRNPATVHEAFRLAENIREGNFDSIAGTLQNWSYKKIIKGDWGAVQFYSPYLTSTFSRIRTGELFDVTNLGIIAKLDSTYRSARSAFSLASNPDQQGRRALWHFKTDLTNTMRTGTDSSIIAKNNQIDADRVWERRSRFLIPVKVQTNLARVIAVRLNEPSLGSYWVTVHFREEKEITEKAVCLWLNSTLGIISMLGIRTPKKPCYPDFSIQGQNQILVPNMSKKQLESMAEAYDLNADVILGKWADADDPVRVRLDDAVADIIGVDSEIIATARRELAREPMCTNRRYASSP